MEDKDNETDEEFEEGDRVIITEGEGKNYVGRITKINEDGKCKVDNGNNKRVGETHYYWKEPDKLTKDIVGWRSSR